MPRGGHFGLWKPTPKDIFKSRWKRFYKRTYRDGRIYRGNSPDVGVPKQPLGNHDAVPNPWKLLVSTGKWSDDKVRWPQDLKYTEYMENQRQEKRDSKKKENPTPKTMGQRAAEATKQYLKPAEECINPAGRETILRVLDSGRRGGGDSGFGRLGPVTTVATSNDNRLHAPHLPFHIFEKMEAYRRGQNTKQFLEIVKQRSDAKDQKGSEDGEEVDQTGLPLPLDFPVRRLEELMHEQEIVWDGGLQKPKDDNKYGEAGGGEISRGHFPYIDEQASLVQEFTLSDILRLAHKTKSRRHPKWLTFQFEQKKRHSAYLRRREMNNDEAKRKMGVLRQAMSSS